MVRPATGAEVANVRSKFDMTREQLSRIVGVSAATSGNGEREAGPLALQARTLEAWTAVSGLTRPEAWSRYWSTIEIS
ncbi:MAG: hypothetical protein HY720_26250 [Planctomycetes bacterium]|nr:hypothetical protein [Planctomycetota bacterium]